MEKSRYINPTKTRGKKKKKQAVKLSSLCDCCSRDNLLSSCLMQKLINLLMLPMNVIIVESNQYALSQQKILYSYATCEEQNHQHPICTTFKKASLNGKTNSSSTKPMLATSEYLSPISRFTNKTSSMPLQIFICKVVCQNQVTPAQQI